MRHANWGFVTRKSPRSSSIRDEGGGGRREGSPSSRCFADLSRAYILHPSGGRLITDGLNGERNEVSRFRIRSFAPRVSGLIA